MTHCNFKNFIGAFLLSVFAFSASAQEQKLGNKNPYPVKYVSDVDQNLILKTVTMAPAYDNVGGIYKNAAEKKLKELISSDYFWSLNHFVSGEASLRPDALDNNPELVRSVLNDSKADSLIRVIITKSMAGMNVSLSLYTKDGNPLINLTEKDRALFEISKFDSLIERMYQELKQKLPYDGSVLSRSGNTVTINIGSKKGLKANDQLTVAQILKINRHPKLKFMTGVEKEIIGQLRITKADPDLSFATISFEKESGVVQKGSKLLPFNSVRYESGQPIAVDKENQEWVPAEPAQYGKVSLGVGVTDYSLSAVSRNTGDSYESSKNLAPTLKLGVELWITQEWYASLNMQQTFFSTSNGLSGSSPGKLNFNNGLYDLLLGYKYSLTGDFWGPQLNFGFGYLSSTTRMSDSNPVAFTSMDLKSMQMQIGGHFPISEDYKKAVGAHVKFLLFEKLSESPVNSGSSDPRYSQFGIYYSQHVSANFRIRPEINYSLLSSHFSGSGSNATPVRSVDEKALNFNFGIEYLF